MMYTAEDIQRIDDSNNVKEFSKIYLRRIWGIRKPGILYTFTTQEAEEYYKCERDILYFAEQYCKTFDPLLGERRKIVLRDFQSKLLKSLQDERFNIAMTSRQVGLTLIESIWLLHNLIFSNAKTILVMDEKLMISREKMDKVVEMYRGLPFFMKPGITIFRKTMIRTDRGSYLITPSVKNPFVGAQVHVLNIGNCGKISEKVSDVIYNTLIPIMNSLKGSRIFLSNSGSTGYNRFYQTFDGAESGRNEFKSHRVYWWQVPGRGEEWKNKETMNLGSRKKFEEEYNLFFIEKREHKLPHFSELPRLPITPIHESLFEIQANLPIAFLENIISYDLDVVNKRISFAVNLNEETLTDLTLLSTESIKILHHDVTGKVLIKTELETITNPSFMSTSASYDSQNLLTGRFTFHYGTIYQNFKPKL
jgi:hypothetical protein